MRNKRLGFLIFTCIVGIGIMILLALGNKPKPFTGMGSYLSISPNDQQLAFSHYKGGRAAIYLANRDGTAVQQLTEPKKASHLSPSFSPDGKRILFLEKPEEEDFQTLWMMNTDGTGKKRISGRHSLITEAIFSPSGKQIYFIAAASYEHDAVRDEDVARQRDIYLMNVDGTNVEQLTYVANDELASLSLSPNGRKLYTTMTSSPNFYSLYELDPVTKKMQDVLGNVLGGARIYDVTLSPDGTRAAFSAVAGETQITSVYTYEIYVMRLDTKQLKQVTEEGGYVTKPVFFNQEKRLLFLKNPSWPETPNSMEIWEVDLEGFGKKQILLSL